MTMPYINATTNYIDNKVLLGEELACRLDALFITQGGFSSENGVSLVWRRQ